MAVSGSSEMFKHVSGNGNGESHGLPFDLNVVREAGEKLKARGCVLFDIWEGRNSGGVGGGGESHAEKDVVGSSGIGSFGETWDGDAWAGFWSTFLPDGDYTTGQPDKV
jgi:hypothetical protein